MSKLLGGCLTAIALVLFAPAMAGAATPFTAGNGNKPSVAVGADGSGHVVWTDTSGGNAKIGYCRVAPGASNCNHAQVLTFPDGAAANSAGHPQVFSPTPNDVMITGACWNCGGASGNRIYRWDSGDNGTSFGGGGFVTSGFQTHGRGEILSDSSVYVASNAASVKAGPWPDGGGIVYASGGTFSFTPQVVEAPGAFQLVAAVNDLNQIRYAVYAGPMTAAGVNTPAAWAAHSNKTLSSPESTNRESSLNRGPGGVYLTYRVLDFPDLTVDGSFTTGAATAAILITGGTHPALATLAAGVAGRHVYVQAQPAGTYASCGASLEWMMEINPLFEVVRKVLGAPGDCANIDWSFLGLAMPAWVLLWALALGALGMIANWPARPTRG